MPFPKVAFDANQRSSKVAERPRKDDRLYLLLILVDWNLLQLFFATMQAIQVRKSVNSLKLKEDHILRLFTFLTVLTCMKAPSGTAAELFSFAFASCQTAP